MRKKTRTVLRKSGHKPPPLAVVSIRVSLDTWTRCGWAAQAKGVNRNEFVRDTLADATRNAKAPNTAECRGLGSESEQAAWECTAKHYGLTVDEFMRQSANVVVKKLAILEAERNEQ
jgi:hypothetical protein